VSYPNIPYPNPIGQEQARFVRHIPLTNKMYAEFSDPQGGPDFFLDFEECQERLSNLRDNNFPCEETERALIEWPERAD